MSLVFLGHGILLVLAMPSYMPLRGRQHLELPAGKPRGCCSPVEENLFAAAWMRDTIAISRKSETFPMTIFGNGWMGLGRNAFQRDHSIFMCAQLSMLVRLSHSARPRAGSFRARRHEGMAWTVPRPSPHPKKSLADKRESEFNHHLAGFLWCLREFSSWRKTGSARVGLEFAMPGRFVSCWPEFLF